MSGAPRARTPGPSELAEEGRSPARATALHFREEEKGTSAVTGSRWDGKARAIAALVLLPALALAASAPRAPLSRSSEPSTGWMAATCRRFAVSVPVLSMQSTSTLLSDSTAFACWTSAPKRTIRSEPRA